MKKIAIPGKNFNRMCGAIDFLRMLIKSLMKEEKNKFFLLLPYSCPEDIEQTKIHFTEFGKDLEIVPYLHPDIQSALDIINPDVVIPTYDDFEYPQVSYLFDCQHRYYPEFFTQKEIDFRDGYFQRIVDTKKSIIVNSKDAKNDLVKFFNVKEENIFNLPFCPILNRNYLQALDYDVLEKFNLPKTYFIISNQFWIHKSHITAFEAIKILKEKGYSDICLVCTGTIDEPRNPEYIDMLKSKLKEWNIEENVKLLGFIDKREQIELLKKSISVIQPTLFEGGPGGGSIYDAIAVGQRAILTDIRINLELQNEQNLKYFIAKDVNDLANKMEEDLNNPFTRISDDILIKNEQAKLYKLTTRVYEAVEKAIS